MTRRVYLTVDDSPSPMTGELVRYLSARGVPAILFFRGDRAEADPGPLVEAVRKGFVLGNHSYAHHPAGDLSFEEWVEDFEKAEALAAMIYREAGCERPGLYQRFSYLDRGDGDRVERRFPALIRDVTDGKNPGLPEDARVRRIQDFLKARGFRQPFKNVTHPLYKIPEIAGAADCFLTYSTCDWMLTKRHIDKDWPYKSLNDLKGALDADPWLSAENGTGIVLVHDQDETTETAIALTEHMLQRGFEFQGFEAG